MFGLKKSKLVIIYYVQLCEVVMMAKPQSLYKETLLGILLLLFK